MKEYRNGTFVGERALYNVTDAAIYSSVFEDGESPLKECRNIEVRESVFKWKYPMWYSRDVKVYDSTLLVSARSGIWYTHGIEMHACSIEAPKTFRRSSGIKLVKCSIPHAEETLWSCTDVVMDEISAVGDYFGMNAKNVVANKFDLDGNYAFDGAENVEIRNSRLISKDAFWNAKNVTVYDSLIVGEYLGWNSENVTFINCTIESNQGLCYMDNLRLVNCTFENTDLAFELSSVDAEINSHVDSVKSPRSGKIKAKSIGEIIIDSLMVDPEKTKIEYLEGEPKRSLPEERVGQNYEV